MSLFLQVSLTLAANSTCLHSHILHSSFFTPPRLHSSPHLVTACFWAVFLIPSTEPRQSCSQEKVCGTQESSQDLGAALHSGSLLSKGVAAVDWIRGTWSLVMSHSAWPVAQKARAQILPRAKPPRTLPFVFQQVKRES